jgi:hypothetical protein
MKQLLAVVLVALTLAGCGTNVGGGGSGWSNDMWRDIERNNSGGS